MIKLSQSAQKLFKIQVFTVWIYQAVYASPLAILPFLALTNVMSNCHIMPILILSMERKMLMKYEVVHGG